MDLEFWALFAGAGEVWEAARLRGDVDCTWQVLETTLVQRQGLRSDGYQRLAATTRLAGGRGAAAGPRHR